MLIWRKRLLLSPIAWSWAFNVLRLGAGVLLLPLLLKLLPPKDLGMYYVFLSLNAFGPLIDFGFLNSIDRAVGYAMGGANELRAHGVPQAEGTGKPNYSLLWKLLYTARRLYAWLCLALLLLLGAGGTYLVGMRVEETASPTHTWIAWAIALFATCVELYSSWWNIYLRSMNFVLLCMRNFVAVYLVKFVLSCVLLLLGGGLLAVPLAGLIAAAFLYILARRQCLNFLNRAPHPPPSPEAVRNLIRVLWPNTWRVGVQFLSGYFTTNTNAFICLTLFGLAATAEYGLSVQIINVVGGMALVWTQVKWPRIQQCRARNDLRTLRKIFWPRVWLQKLTFIGMAAVVVPLIPLILERLAIDKNVLPMHWFALLAVNGFLEVQLSMWTTLIITTNRTPFLWFFVASNASSLGVTLLLAHTTSLGLGALVLGPLITGLAFNYWYWPIRAVKTLDTAWLPFLLSKPQ